MDARLYLLLWFDRKHGIWNIAWSLSRIKTPYYLYAFGYRLIPFQNGQPVSGSDVTGHFHAWGKRKPYSDDLNMMINRSIDKVPLNAKNSCHR